MDIKEFLKELTKENTRNPIWIKQNAKIFLKEISDNKALHIAEDSGSASDFEKDLGKLINNYVKAGLKKPDLVKKMEWMTGNCKFS